MSTNTHKPELPFEEELPNQPGESLQFQQIELALKGLLIWVMIPTFFFTGAL